MVISGRRHVQRDLGEGYHPATVIARLHTEALQRSAQDVEARRRSASKVRDAPHVQRRGYRLVKFNGNADNIVKPI
jgi:hypothetical protein